MGFRMGHRWSGHSRFSNVVLFAILTLYWSPLLTSQAQVTTGITSDGTLGTVVTQMGNLHEITGGTRPGNGPNLFHSFGQLNVGAADIADFRNDAGFPTENILSRVTGGNPSQIFGSIQTTNFGNANLFLLNPAGIVFGPDASLNVGGGTHFTTADYLRLSDGVQFTALPSSQDTLLNVASVAAFGFLEENPASISIEGNILSVAEGQTLSFVSGDITISSSLNAPGGKIAIASVASPGEMLADTYANAPNVNGQSFGGMGNISLLEGARLDVSGDAGAAVVIRSGRLMVDASTISANTTGPASGALRTLGVEGAGIDIKTTGDLLVDNAAVIEANVLGGSMAGRDIILKAGQNFEIRDNSIVQTQALGGSGNAGNIEVNANKVLIAKSFQGLQSLAFGAFFGNSTGNAGNVHVTANELQMTGGGIAATTVFGLGQAGNIAVSVQGGDIFLGSSVISANSFGSSGNAGHVQIAAAKLTLTNLANIESRSFGGATGNAGSVSVVVNGQLNIRERASITVRSDLTGAEGDLTIAAEDIVITGIREGMFPLFGQVGGDFTGFSTRTSNARGADMRIMAHNLQVTDKGIISGATDGSGSSGNIVINLSEGLRIADGGEISAITTGSGSAGQIELVADTVELSGKNAFSFTETDGTDALAFARISTQTDASGNGGTIGITAKQINILDGGSLTSNSLGEGNGGNIRLGADTILIAGENPAKTGFGLDPRSSITTENEGRIPGPEATGIAGDIFLDAGNTLNLDRGLVSAESGSAGAGGSIQVNAGDLSLFNNSSITARSTSTGNAGNINLFANNTILFDNSTLTTESTESSGGNIDLRARELFRMNSSTLASSVQGDANTIGGNISVDPEFIILQNSQILANAVEGQGGNISLVATNAVLVDPFSRLDASSALGVSGSVDIQAPIQNLSGTIAPLPEDTVPVTALYNARCAAGQDGHFSTFVDSKTDSLSPIPGWFLPSPLPRPSPQANSVADASASLVSPVVLTASIAPLVLGHVDEPVTACP